MSDNACPRCDRPIADTAYVCHYVQQRDAKKERTDMARPEFDDININYTPRTPGIAGEVMQAEPSTETSHILSARRVLASGHDRIEALVERLENRLEDVLLPPFPTEALRESKDSPEMSSLACRIMDEATRIHRTADRIETLITRVDL